MTATLELRPPSGRALLILVLATVLSHVQHSHGRPQALRVNAELATSDHRWDSSETNDVREQIDVEKLEEIVRTFRQSKGLQEAIMEVLKSLREDELSVLERVFLLEGELPQGDMPASAEDLVDDRPQELPAEDGAEDTLAGYRGEVLVLDNVNASAEPPQINSSVPNPYPQTQRVNRENPKSRNAERLKELRIANIKNQIMNTLWPVGSPPTFRGNFSAHQPPGRQEIFRLIAEKMKNPKHLFIPEDIYTEKIQSFYPSCEIPRNTDAELWNDRQTMNLLFELTYPSTLQGTQVNIVAAKLRLYKLSQGNTTLTPDICPPTETEDTPSEEGSVKPLPTSTSSLAEDKMIRVSVYWYTRSLKKHRVKRKLLDSQMLSAAKEKWTEWNIRGAVKSWRDSGRNFGLAVVVEDEDGNMLPTDKFFAPMNCSQEASTSRPIPGFLVARALSTNGAFNRTNHTTGQTLHLDTLLFPMIDLCTIEFSESDTPDANFYRKVGENAEISSRKPARKLHNSTAASTVSQYAPSENDKHRRRHQSHKRGEEGQSLNSKPPHRHLETVRRDDGDSIEEITWADDLDGHQLRKQIIVQKVISKKTNNDDDKR